MAINRDHDPSSWHTAFSRRQAIRSIGTGLAAVPLISSLGEASARAAELEPLNRFPRMVQEFFVEQVRRSEAAHLRRLRSLKTKEDAEAYVRDARKRCRQAFGPNPRRTPLKSRITGIVDREEYTIEKVTDVNEIARYGVVLTPALAVDGQVRSAGKVLDPAAIKALLE